MFATTQISQFTEGSALQAAGAQVGDTIVEVDGYAIYTDRDLSFALALADPAAVSMVVKRDGQRVDLGTFALQSQTLEDGSKIVSLDFYVEPEAVTFLGLVRRSAADTFSMARMVVETLKGHPYRALWPQRCGRAHRHSPGHWPGRQRGPWPRALARRC